MSLETWKKEFYPKKPSKRMSTEDAILHSIQKWTGATKANTRKHSVEYENHTVTNLDGGLVFNRDSCALCFKFDGYEAVTVDKHHCAKCPIYKMQGDDCIWEYGESQNSPVKIIRLLRKTLKWYRASNKR